MMLFSMGYLIVFYCVLNIFSVSSPNQIGYVVVLSITVKMATLHAFGAFPYKCFKHKCVNFDVSRSRLS